MPTLVHDASEGGLAICLAEAALFSGSGASLDVRDDPVELFGEVGGRAVVACAPTAGSDVERVASELGVPLRVVGDGRRRYPPGSGARRASKRLGGH